MSEKISKDEQAFDPREHFVVQMGVFMPEGMVLDDARRISNRGMIDKVLLAQGVAPRQMIAHEIRKRTEELIQAIYEQMDRQENERGSEPSSYTR